MAGTRTRVNFLKGGYAHHHRLHYVMNKFRTRRSRRREEESRVGLSRSHLAATPKNYGRWLRNACPEETTTAQPQDGRLSSSAGWLPKQLTVDD